MVVGGEGRMRFVVEAGQITELGGVHGWLTIPKKYFGSVTRSFR